ncbi:hypothetical protein CASFOL_025208 [Castilleja foliolosa]|uniref:NECAP PHear domain-containing protein n=1 Tax=Castilleja foliolosa TaxID=1961234 RepID=A0ABD3CT04_9LAMI
MEKEKITEEKKEEEEEEVEAVELVLFQVSECYVYMIPPRISAASYRADEWNVNKWSWEGTLKVISKGVECIIRLEDKKTGELYARAFLRDGEPHPVETVIDSSRYFVLRVEENIAIGDLYAHYVKCPVIYGCDILLFTYKDISNEFKCDECVGPQPIELSGRLRHAFIGLGFRERTEAYDFQAALHDHMKYLNKKKTAEEMEQQYQQTSSVDYSLKDGETIVLQLKNQKGGGSIKSKFFEQGGLSNLSLDDKGKNTDTSISIKLPPPPAPLSPVAASGKFPTKFSLPECSETKASESETQHQLQKPEASTKEEAQDLPDDDFGDFQAA